MTLSAVSCNDGDLRLVGGEREYDGLLEVCFSQRWGTVSGDGWSASDTQVACRQLGFDTVGKIRMSYYESGSLCPKGFWYIKVNIMTKESGILSAPIHMDNVACYGSEDKLIDCSYHTTDTKKHQHDEDIWIKCGIIRPTLINDSSEELEPIP